MTRVARDPLFICLVLGMVVFVVDGWLGRPPQQHIEVTAADVARVDAQWRAEMGRPPTEQELSALIDRHVRGEVLYREALRLDLDRNDTIVRRRLAQKLQFVSEDLGTGDPPTEKALRAYYGAHRENYVRHARVTFSHVYESATGFSCTASNAGSPPCVYTVRAANRERPKPCTEQGYNADALKSLSCIEADIMRRFNQFLMDLKAIPEAGGSLLDHTTVVLGSNFGDASNHTCHRLPILVAGGGYKHQQHKVVKEGTPLCNLWLELLNQHNVDAGTFGSGNKNMQLLGV